MKWQPAVGKANEEEDFFFLKKVLCFIPVYQFLWESLLARLPIRQQK